MKPLILVDENIPEAELYFGKLGRIERFSGRNLSADKIGTAKALIVRSVTRVDASLLSSSQVEFVGTCTIGTDHIDQPWLHERGIGFSSAPGCNANSVAEYVIAALAIAEVDWQKVKIGIVGCGNVGTSVYRKLLKLGANVLGCDPLIDQTSLPNMGSLQDVLACDVVCLHTPLTYRGEFPTHHLLSSLELQQLKANALLVSAGRGAVVDNQQLLAVKKNRPDLRLVLDVWEYEPWVCADLLAQTTLGTPHIAGYSWDGKVTGTQMICQSLARFWGVDISQPSTTLREDSTETLAMPLSTDAWQQVRSTVLQAYDILGDDRRLRAMVAGAKSKGDIERGFDDLRRHYPERREFQFCSPLATPTNLAVYRCLRALGFRFIA